MARVTVARVAVVGVTVARVAVVGAVNADYIVRVDRLPQPGETVGGGRLSVRPGGKGANQAHAAGRLGANVLLVASVGSDQAASDERAAMAGDNVSADGLVVAPEPTGIAVILVDANGENSIAVAPGANEALTPDLVTQRLQDWLAPKGEEGAPRSAGGVPRSAGRAPSDAGRARRSADGEARSAGRAPSDAVVLISLEVPLPAAVAAAQTAASAGALTVVNPAPAQPLPEALLRGVVLTPNDGEVRRLVPDAGDEETAIARLLASGARAVIVTRGSSGASLYRQGEPPTHAPTPKVKVVDTVGAGDAFNGALAWSLACGAPLDAALHAATAAGAAACTAVGAREALPTPEILATLLPPATYTAATTSA